jgi:hypothetical protein
MTYEESKTAYDLGNMYAVIPSTYTRELNIYYEMENKAKVGSYNSSDGVPITKEEVRDLLVSEKLI